VRTASCILILWAFAIVVNHSDNTVRRAHS
jgi:hypothetical protein